MKTFKPKDRVKVRCGGRADFKGTVSAVNGENSINVIEDGCHSVHYDAPFHPCQLILLKKKVKLVSYERTPIYLSACRDVHGAWRVQNCESHDGAKIPTPGIQIQFREVLNNQVTIDRLAVDALGYFINNPSVWESFNQSVSDAIERVVSMARELGEK